jgi:MoaA/NifB/PqqE/SkfB family radical SAM enzyme
MKLTGIHMLLTNQCTFECDHCFVWGSPWQSGVMTLPEIRTTLSQAVDLGTVRTIYFEGGEPFLYYSLLVQAVKEAYQKGFKVGIVTNAFWANSLEDALINLKPFAGLIMDLSVSSDLFHYSEEISKQANYANDAAEKLGIPVGMISIAEPEASEGRDQQGQLPEGGSDVMFRGRAAVKLVSKALCKPVEQFTACPHEDLRDPGRVHLDAFGNVHICQGISIGNVKKTSLKAIASTYNPEKHPITGPLLKGGPLELARQHGVRIKESYADACHLCYDSRLALRSTFPNLLTPEGMYGILNKGKNDS